MFSIAHGSHFGNQSLHEALHRRGISCVNVQTPEQLLTIKPACIVLDEELLATASLERWRNNALLATMLSTVHIDDDNIILLPPNSPEESALAILRLSCQQWAIRKRNAETQRLLKEKEGHVKLLTDIGIALSAEKSLPKLLDKILTEAQNIACCDAASLFLIDDSDPKNPQLAFKLTKNDSISMDFKEIRFPLNKQSISGYSAIFGVELCIDDVYALGDDVPYSFNRDFDLQNGYRTRSVLTVPIKDHRNTVLGVLQFLNRKRDRDTLLRSEAQTMRETVPFDESTRQALRALTSQSAVALENHELMESINHLFSGFVRASVTAIEQRDPTTSGHSFRVADLTCELARVLPLSNVARFKSTRINENEMRELRYASLLHDFGKVGVRESVLVKAKKLPEGGFESIRQRIRFTQERMKRKALEKILHEGKHSQKDSILAEVQIELDRLDDFLKAIQQANQPTILPDGSFEYLQQIAQYPFDTDDEHMPSFLITEQEHRALSIRKGSLTEEERLEIESHATHTANFLKLIPWTPELARIPDIAGAHHEKLNGKGYPNGKTDLEIPLGAKLMTICDIFDALTASDRPYKKAMPLEGALKILGFEAKDGHLDQDLVNIFIEGQVFKILEGRDYRADLMGANLSVKKGMYNFDLDGESDHIHTNHVCDHGCLERHAHKI